MVKLFKNFKMIKFSTSILLVCLAVIIHSQTPVTWINGGGVTINGNSITKTASASYSNAGASSLQKLPSGVDGYAEFTVGSISHIFYGLATSDPDLSVSSINYAIQIRPNPNPGFIMIYESGQNVHNSTVAYSIGDVFRVERSGNTILYKKNGTTFHQTNNALTGQLLIDAALYETSSKINNAIFFSSQSTPPSPPTAPTNVTAISNSTSQITVNWTAVVDATIYQIDRATNNTFSEGLTNFTSSTNSYVSTGLLAAITYFYRVRAVNAAGTSPNSVFTSAITQTSGGGGGSSGNWVGAVTRSYHIDNVHIGKSNTTTGTETDYSLFVAKGIKTEKYKLEIATAGGWADYVFNKDYKLTPINQLKNYIDKNKHLPNFPSTKEILNEGGYEMGDMIRRQQEAIEHLHLYIIELEKRLKVLENKKENSKGK
jgi:hypothetical protein